MLQIGLAVYLVALVVLALSFGEFGGRPVEVARLLVDPILLGVTVAALLWGRSRVARTERRFWDLLALAWGCWLLVDVLYFLELDVPFLSAGLVTDGLYTLYYLVFALAMDSRPHLSRERTLTAMGRRLESSAGLAAVFGLLIYFALVVLPEPLGVSLSFVPRDRGLTPLLLVRISLDVLILGRLVFAVLSAEGRWRRLYAFLAAGMLGYLVRDALSLMQYEEILSSTSSLGDQPFLYLPGLVVVVAARYRLVPTLENQGLGSESAAQEVPDIARPSPIALYALLVPGVHFLFYPLGLLDPASHNSREIFCLVYILILGALAWLHQRVLTEDNRIARAALLEAEERLSRTRKLESVGRLAGGIAHDFNNYLTVILGYSELLRERLRGTPEQPTLEYIEDAARKATHLTRQLLAFGRRQVLRPEALDLNAVVRDTAKMLDSLLGEDVVLDMDLDPEAGLVRADLGQTEQVLVNLSLNGRDALPSGGTLAIRTRRTEIRTEEASQLEIEPGSYACLVVADTGVGMSAEVRRRAFEPFFTTKELGRGTGLGLSTVYGVVAQSGGAITVDSASGEGTTITVLLPSAAAPAIVGPAPEPLPPRDPEATNLLLVEDEDGVRRLASVALSRAGFQVHSAADGADAVARFLEDSESIDLLITDVLMPGMDGVELANVFQQRCPTLRVLFLSGYPADTLRERHKALPRSLRLLQKPFSPSKLIEVVHEVLDESLPIPAVDSLMNDRGA